MAILQIYVDDDLVDIARSNNLDIDNLVQGWVDDMPWEIAGEDNREDGGL